MIINLLKISLITVCYNAAATLSKCIDSVLAQSYGNLEYIIIDGASTDGTPALISGYGSRIDHFISEPDNGLYDAMNKGIGLATGQVIGILNADDYFISNTVISAVAQAFQQSGADVVYANLNFVNPLGRIVRRWRSGSYVAGAFNRGWMPAHPAFYAKKSLFEQHGAYRLDYGSAADYELMMRMIHVHRVNVFYLNMTLLHMLTGGISNKSLINRVNIYKFDLKAMKDNQITYPRITLLLKPLRKIRQYLPGFFSDK